MSQRRISDRVVVLDRDGTIVIDRNYLDDPAALSIATRRRHVVSLRPLTRHNPVRPGFTARYFDALRP